MNLKNKILIMVTILFALIGNSKAFAVNNNLIKQITEPKSPVTVDKKWKINFSKQLNKSSVTEDSIKVLDKNGQVIKINIILSSDEKSVEITPISSSYVKGETYSIVITKTVKDKTNKSLKQETRMNFKIQKDTLSTSSSSGSMVKVDPAVKKAREGLIKIKPIVKTQREKDLVDYLVNSIDKRIKDLSYKINSEDVKKRYRSLLVTEQEDFENIICSTFTIGELMDIRDALGV